MMDPNSVFLREEVRKVFLSVFLGFDLVLYTFLGTIFLLIIMAIAKQRARVRDSEITEDIWIIDWIRLNYLL